MVGKVQPDIAVEHQPATHPPLRHLDTVDIDTDKTTIVWCQVGSIERIGKSPTIFMVEDHRQQLKEIFEAFGMHPVKSRTVEEKEMPTVGIDGACTVAVLPIEALQQLVYIALLLSTKRQERYPQTEKQKTTRKKSHPFSFCL